ncbi:MAG: DUF6160 family protein [bacterium]
MAWITETNSRRRWLRLIILALAGLLVIGGTFAVSAKMRSMTRNEMSSVAGREGIKLDISLQGSVNTVALDDSNGAQGVSGNAGFGRVRLGGGSGKRLTFNDGTGSPAALEGMTIDVDGSGNLVLGLPQGDLTVDVPWTSIVSSSTALGGGSSFGKLKVNNLSVGNTTVRASGLGDGLKINMDIGIDASEVRYRDPDGSSQDGSAGNVTLRNVDIGDFNDNSQPTLSGMELHADGNGVATVFPASSNSTVNFEAEVGEILAGGSSFGQFQIDDMNWDGSNLILKPSGDGLDGEFNIRYQAENIKLTDQNGWNGSGSSGTLIGASNVAIGASPWSGVGNETINFKLDGDANRGAVFRTDDSDQTIDARIENLKLGGGSLGLVDLSDANLGHNRFEIQPSNTGIEIDGQLSFSIDFEARLKDLDSGDGGQISLGRTTNGVALLGTASGDEKFSFSDLTINADPTNGLVIKPFSREVWVDVKDVYVGNEGGPWNSLGSFRIRETDFAGSRFELSGKGDGLDVDGTVDFQAEEIRVVDSDGVQQSGFSGTSGTFHLCDNAVDCITFDDGSGNPASFSNLQVDADGSDGLVVEGPTLSDYEFESDNVKLDNSTVFEPVTVRDINTSGSWLKVDAR